MRIACLQPEYPHYRNDFFKLLQNKVEVFDLYAYNQIKDTESNGFKVTNSTVKYIKNLQIKGILLYNIFTFICGNYNTLVLMLNFTHLSTWLLLLTKIFHRKKIILWGQGISVKRYLKEEKNPDWKLKLMISLADGVWVYMDKECEQWRKIFPKKKIVALHNTISGIEDISSYQSALSKEALKDKYGVLQETIFIYCARFTNPYRRVDVLLNTIEKLDPSKFGFIIIGDGTLKPDFSKYKNVYDFGAVYDKAIKQDLFTLSDIYLQPGWVGLSIVEAMAYGKPVFTLERSEETKQCVEYSYIKNEYNGLIFKTDEELLQKINSLNNKDISLMSSNAYNFALNLTNEKMTNNAYSIL